MARVEEIHQEYYKECIGELNVLAWDFEKKFNCLKITLYPQKGFLKCNTSDEEKTEVTVDACLADEILELWNQGIHTTGCCCGHGKILGFIGVIDEDIPKMKELGYNQYIYNFITGGPSRGDAFVPKTYGHIVNSSQMYTNSGY